MSTLWVPEAPRMLLDQWNSVGSRFHTLTEPTESVQNLQQQLDQINARTQALTKSADQMLRPLGETRRRLQEQMGPFADLAHRWQVAMGRTALAHLVDLSPDQRLRP